MMPLIRPARLGAGVLLVLALAACSGGSQVAPAGAPPATTAVQGSDLTPLTAFTARDAASGQLVHVYPSREQLGLPGVRDALARSSGSNMTNHGGLVQTQPKVYVVFWGSAWNGSSGDPDGGAAYLTAFVRAAGGSAWLGTVTQYGAGNAAALLGNTWNDTSSSPPLRPSTRQIAAEAAAAAAHFGDTSVNANYIVAMPHGVAPSGFKSQWCAYHSTVTAGSATVAYTALPYQPDAGTGCGADAVAGVNDGFAIVGGHEIAEAITDPLLDAWYDSQQEEIGDKCAWIQLERNPSVGYPTQPLWSNAVTGCTQGS